MFYLRDYMLIIFQMSIISEICIGCPHALAGKNYSFYGILKHSLQEKVEIVWLRNKIPVSMCRSNLACYGYDETKTMTSLKYLGNSKYEFNLTLTNVTKMDESIWSLKYLGLASLRQPHFMFSCNLRVFDISILTIQNCPSIVKESSIVHCECSLIENTAINIDFGWYDSTNMIMNNSNHLLVYNASMEEDGYECKGISDAGLNNLPLPYEPLIIATIDNFDCSLHYNKTVFYMLCTFQRIYPEAICDILIEGEELRINIVSNKDNLVHNSYPWPENNRYYSSECFQFLPFILIFENFTAIVTASLNITGTEKDSFSQTKTFHFNPKLLIDESVLLSEINELLSFRICIAVLYLIVVLLLLLFTIMFKKGAFCFCKIVPSHRFLQVNERINSTKQSLKKGENELHGLLDCFPMNYQHIEKRKTKYHKANVINEFRFHFRNKRNIKFWESPLNKTVINESDISDLENFKKH